MYDGRGRNMDNILGSRIRDLREKNDISQIELSKKLNISNTTLSQYESGKRIPSDEIKLKIADHFNVSIDYLLGRTDNPKEYIEPEGNLDKENIEFKTYEEIFIELRKNLEDQGLIEKDKPIPKEIMKMLLEYGESASVAILKARDKEGK